MVRALRVRAPRGRRPRTAVSPLRPRPVGWRTAGAGAVGTGGGAGADAPCAPADAPSSPPPPEAEAGASPDSFQPGAVASGAAPLACLCAVRVSGPAARGAVGAAAASGAPDSSVGCQPPCRWAERCPRAPAGAVCAVSSAVDGAASPGSAATPARAPEAGVRAPPHTRAPGLLVTVGRGCLRDRRAHVRRRRARSDADAVTAGAPGTARGTSVASVTRGAGCPALHVASLLLEARVPATPTEAVLRRRTRGPGAGRAWRAAARHTRLSSSAGTGHPAGRSVSSEPQVAHRRVSTQERQAKRKALLGCCNPAWRSCMESERGCGRGACSCRTRFCLSSF